MSVIVTALYRRYRAVTAFETTLYERARTIQQYYGELQRLTVGYRRLESHRSPNLCGRGTVSRDVRDDHPSRRNFPTYAPTSTAAGGCRTSNLLVSHMETRITDTSALQGQQVNSIVSHLGSPPDSQQIIGGNPPKAAKVDTIAPVVIH